MLKTLAFAGLVASIAAGCAAQTEPPKPAAALPAAPAAAPDKPVIHPEAHRVLKAVCDRLAAAQTLGFKAEIWEDQVLGGGQKLSVTRTVDLQMQRPNALRADTDSAKRSRGIWYDGKTVALLDKRNNVYGTFAAPPTIDAMLDAARDQYGITLPLDDFIVSDPYASAMSGIQAGAYFGKVKLLGVPCEHVGFSSGVVDWQLWVEEGGMPRKLVITYKKEPAQPQFTAIFTDWSVGAPISASTFTFTPPAGAVSAKVTGDPAGN